VSEIIMKAECSDIPFSIMKFTVSTIASEWRWNNKWSSSLCAIKVACEHIIMQDPKIFFLAFRFPMGERLLLFRYRVNASRSSTIKVLSKAKCILLWQNYQLLHGERELLCCLPSSSFSPNNGTSRLMHAGQTHLRLILSL
jgi:hypothetical protein